MHICITIFFFQDPYNQVKYKATFGVGALNALGIFYFAVDEDTGEVTVANSLTALKNTDEVTVRKTKYFYSVFFK